MPARPTHVLDASALIAYLKGEPGQEVVGELLRDDATVLVIHTMNLCEVYGCYFRLDGQAQAEAAWENTCRISQVCVHTDDGFIKRVARWKEEQRLAMLDSFVAATAETFWLPDSYDG